MTKLDVYIIYLVVVLYVNSSLFKFIIDITLIVLRVKIL